MAGVVTVVVVAGAAGGIFTAFGERLCNRFTAGVAEAAFILILRIAAR